MSFAPVTNRRARNQEPGTRSTSAELGMEDIQTDTFTIRHN